MLEEKLQALEQLYRGVLPWYATLYDKATGGFYGAASGRDDPTLYPGLEMTGSALLAIKRHNNALWERMPDALRERFIEFFLSRFNPASGYFEDPAMIECDRNTADRYRARIQSFSRNTLTALNAPLAPPAAAGETAASPVLPEQFASPERYVKWISTLSWDTNSWTAGDRVQASQNYIRMMEEERRTPYIDAMFVWLEAHQHPKTGYWGSDDSYCSLSGTFKVDLIYATHQRPLPNAERILASIFHTIETKEAVNPYYVRNSLDVLKTLASCHGMADAIRARLPRYLDGILAAERTFLAPDGGFSATPGKSMSVYGGVRVGHSLNEGDVDATSMMLLARQTLYMLLDMPLPPLSATFPDFWNHL